jgi:hypothetical protein
MITTHILAHIGHMPLCGAPTPLNLGDHPHIADGRIAASQAASCDDCKCMNGFSPPASVQRRVERRRQGLQI